jgi:hypothetical protein
VTVYFSQKEASVLCNRFKDGRTAPNDDPEKQRSIPRASHTDENCVIVESLIREDRRVKIREIADSQYSTSFAREHCREGIFVLVRRWAQQPNTNNDYVDK